MSQTKKKVAVFFGGRSPEHDVSVVTGLQALKAIDRFKYDAFPVYGTTDGRWLIGEVLSRRENYIPDRVMQNAMTEVTLDQSIKPGKRKGRLIRTKKELFKNPVVAEFDIALPAFHGAIGEDGNFQGLCETAGVPYAGTRTMASSILMDKAITKHLLRALDIPTLPFVKLVRDPEEGYSLPLKEIESLMKSVGYPAILKPVHMGSSIGIAKVNNDEEVRQCLPAIFKSDYAAIAEPFVENMVEYNVSVARLDGRIKTSAFEQPKMAEELLDFKQKYLSGGDDKTGNKIPGDISEGMLSLTRELNPSLPQESEINMRQWAVALFKALDGAGAPRIDFISNKKTGEIWLNEVNPCPGSFGYFLWEAAEDPVLFTDFLSRLLEEAETEHIKRQLEADPVPMDARLHKRST